MKLTSSQVADIIGKLTDETRVLAKYAETLDLDEDHADFEYTNGAIGGIEYAIIAIRAAQGVKSDS